MLWDVEAVTLEKALVEPFQDDYERLLAEASFDVEKTAVRDAKDRGVNDINSALRPGGKDMRLLQMEGTALILGDEYDEELWATLGAVLKGLGGRRAGMALWDSQEIDHFTSWSNGVCGRGRPRGGG